MIPYARQQINEEDIEAVLGVLRSEYLTQGPVIECFERSVAALVGVTNAVAVNSATSALHIACLSLGVGVGDVVWTSAITFAASANCALYCGAQIDFVDINKGSYNISVEALEEKLILAKRENRLPKVLIPVHLAGHSCEMERIFHLSKVYGFHIIEDASHAIGGSYKGAPVGSCKYSDITIFSFHPVKIITTGEGGMALTNNPVLARKMRLLRSHGITSDPIVGDDETLGEIWNYQQIALGFNYRMTDIHAALGMSQLKRLHSFINQRSSLALRYNNNLSGMPLSLPTVDPDVISSHHLYIVRLHPLNKSGIHSQIFQSLREVGIIVNLHYIPVYRHPYYKSLGFSKGYCPEAERYFADAITLPLFPGLSGLQQDEVVLRLKQFIWD